MYLMTLKFSPMKIDMSPLADINALIVKIWTDLDVFLDKIGAKSRVTELGSERNW